MQAPNIFKTVADKSAFQKQVLKAAQLLATPVKQTLGPDGLPILLERPGQTPLSTKDGVTVANSIFVKDPQLDVIVQTIKEAALNTNTIAGDGTTTAILLTEAIIKESQPYLQTNAIAPQALGDSLTVVAEKICAKLKSWAVKVNQNIEAVKQVAYVSCNGDNSIAGIVTEAIDSVGVDGVITLDEGGGEGNSVKIENGFAIERGYGSLGPNGNILINSHATQEVILKEPAILLYDGIVDNVNDFLGGAVSNITCGATRSVPIVVFAHDFTPQVVHALLVNAAKGVLNIMPVKVPRLGPTNSRTLVMEDLAVLTKGKVLTPGIVGWEKIESGDSEYIGSADKVVSGRKQTLIYNGDGSAEAIKERANEIKIQIKEGETEFEKQIFRERLGRLVGGMAVISVGGTTDLEIKEKRDRIEDALNATRVALEEGIVPGGGTAILKAFIHVSQDMETEMKETSKYDVAMSIMEKVCQSPLRQLVANTGKRSPDLIVEQVSEKLLLTSNNFGYNSRKNELIEDMVVDGVIDPVKVVCVGLMNAVSIASLLLKGGGSVVFQERLDVAPPEAAAQENE